MVTEVKLKDDTLLQISELKDNIDANFKGNRNENQTRDWKFWFQSVLLLCQNLWNLEFNPEILSSRWDKR